MFAVVVLTWRRLWIHLLTQHHWLNFTKFASIFRWAATSVLIYSIHACPTILAHVIHKRLHVSTTTANMEYALHHPEVMVTSASVHLDIQENGVNI
jgi:hypothetical protein